MVEEIGGLTFQFYSILAMELLQIALLQKILGILFLARQWI